MAVGNNMKTFLVNEAEKILALKGHNRALFLENLDLINKHPLTVDILSSDIIIRNGDKFHIVNDADSFEQNIANVVGELKTHDDLQKTVAMYKVAATDLEGNRNQVENFDEQFVTDLLDGKLKTKKAFDQRSTTRARLVDAKTISEDTLENIREAETALEHFFDKTLVPKDIEHLERNK